MGNQSFFVICYPGGDETRLAIRHLRGTAEEDRHHLASARRYENIEDARSEMMRLAAEAHAAAEHHIH